MAQFLSGSSAIQLRWSGRFYSIQVHCSILIVTVKKMLKSVNREESFPSSALTLLVGQQEGHLACKKLCVVCWWWRFDWRILFHISYSSSCHHHLPSSLAPIKIQNGDIMVPANPNPPGKWLFNQRESTEKKKLQKLKWHSFFTTQFTGRYCQSVTRHMILLTIHTT